MHALILMPLQIPELAYSGTPKREPPALSVSQSSKPPNRSLYAALAFRAVWGVASLRALAAGAPTASTPLVPVLFAARFADEPPPLPLSPPALPTDSRRFVDAEADAGVAPPDRSLAARLLPLLAAALSPSLSRPEEDVDALSSSSLSTAPAVGLRQAGSKQGGNTLAQFQ